MIQYLNDPTGLVNVVDEFDGSGNVIAHNTYGLGLTSRVTGIGTGSNIYYYDFDAIGSTAGVSGVSGTYMNSYSYFPFGGSLSTVATVPNPYQFIGEFGVTQQAEGCAFMRARCYDAGVGRFTSHDPVGLAGGDTNWYRYAANAPTRFIDPFGFAAVSTRTAAVGLVVAYLDEDRPTIHLPADDQPVITNPGGDGGGGNPSDVIVGIGLGAPFIIPAVTAVGIIGVAVVGEFGLPFIIFAQTSEFAGAAIGSFLAVSGIDEELPPGFQLPLAESGEIAETVIGIIAHAFDPNEKEGPGGFGLQRYVASTSLLSYRIDFENAATATAPAQTVTITDQLASTLDWSTFRLTEIGFGDTSLAIPASAQHYQTTVSMTYNGKTFNVLIEAGIHSDTGQAYATFQSIDPNTELPPDVLTGFLPPEDGTGRGMGHISYTILANASLPTGTQIRNVALITFDQNGAIATDQVDDEDPSQGVDPNKEDLITIDSGPPTSSVSPLSAFSTAASFTLSWSGSDDTGGSGIASYDVYVSDNGGPFVPFLQATTETSAMFPGIDSHTYAFYSIAIDNVGNRQPTPATAQATTTIDATPPTSSVQALPSFSPVNFTVSWSGQDGLGGSGMASFDIYVSDNSGPFVSFLLGTTQTSATFSGSNGHSYGFYSVATDHAGNRETTPAGAQAATTVVIARAFAVVGFPSPIRAGTAGTFTLTAYDVNGYVATGYTGTVHFASSDPQASLPADYTFTSGDGGSHTFTATLKTAGTQSLTATDSVVNGVTGTQSGIVVSAAPASSLSVSGFPSPTVAGATQSFTVSARDAFGNVATSYRGTLRFASSDRRAQLPVNYVFTSGDSGTHTFTATLKTAGSQSLTATDTHSGSITGRQTGIVVTSAAAVSFSVNGPSSITAGVAGRLTVTARDPFGNVATSYSGTVHFTSSDPHAVLPANYAFMSSDAGVHSFMATLKTAGRQSFTATDTATSTITGQANVTVNPAAASVLGVTGFPSPIAAGTAASFIVTTFDPYGNIATGYRGTIHFSSSDSAASLPANYMFTAADAGRHTFTATLNTPGTQSITARDTVRSSTAGTQSGIHVTAALMQSSFPRELLDTGDARSTTAHDRNMTALFAILSVGKPQRASTNRADLSVALASLVRTGSAFEILKLLYGGAAGQTGWKSIDDYAMRLEAVTRLSARPDGRYLLTIATDHDDVIDAFFAIPGGFDLSLCW
jgi:RHS repeat-associated protein